MDAAAAAEETAAWPAPRLRAAYFIHLPFARAHDPSHQELARAVAELIVRLVRLEGGAG